MNKYDDEQKYGPGFNLVALDPLGPILVRLWAHFAEVSGLHSIEKVQNAIERSEQMEKWRAVFSPDESALTLAKLAEAVLLLDCEDEDGYCIFCEVDLKNDAMHLDECVIGMALKV